MGRNSPKASSSKGHTARFRINHNGSPVKHAETDGDLASKFGALTISDHAFITILQSEEKMKEYIGLQKKERKQIDHRIWQIHFTTPKKKRMRVLDLLLEELIARKKIEMSWLPKGMVLATVYKSCNIPFVVDPMTDTVKVKPVRKREGSSSITKYQKYYNLRSMPIQKIDLGIYNLTEEISCPIISYSEYKKKKRHPKKPTSDLSLSVPTISYSEFERRKKRLNKPWSRFSFDCSTPISSPTRSPGFSPIYEETGNATPVQSLVESDVSRSWLEKVPMSKKNSSIPKEQCKKARNLTGLVGKNAVKRLLEEKSLFSIQKDSSTGIEKLLPLAKTQSTSVIIKTVRSKLKKPSTLSSAEIAPSNMKTAKLNVKKATKMIPPPSIITCIADFHREDNFGRPNLPPFVQSTNNFQSRESALIDNSTACTKTLQPVSSKNLSDYSSQFDVINNPIVEDVTSEDQNDARSLESATTLLNYDVGNLIQVLEGTEEEAVPIESTTNDMPIQQRPALDVSIKSSSRPVSECQSRNGRQITSPKLKTVEANRTKISSENLHLETQLVPDTSNLSNIRQLDVNSSICSIHDVTLINENIGEISTKQSSGDCTVLEFNKPEEVADQNMEQLVPKSQASTQVSSEYMSPQMIPESDTAVSPLISPTIELKTLEMESSVIGSSQCSQRLPSSLLSRLKSARSSNMIKYNNSSLSSYSQNSSLNKKPVADENKDSCFQVPTPWTTSEETTAVEQTKKVKTAQLSRRCSQPSQSPTAHCSKSTSKSNTAKENKSENALSIIQPANEDEDSSCFRDPAPWTSSKQSTIVKKVEKTKCQFNQKINVTTKNKKLSEFPGYKVVKNPYTKMKQIETMGANKVKKVPSNTVENKIRKIKKKVADPLSHKIIKSLPAVMIMKRKEVISRSQKEDGCLSKDTKTIWSKNSRKLFTDTEDEMLSDICDVKCNSRDKSLSTSGLEAVAKTSNNEKNKPMQSASFIDVAEGLKSLSLKTAKKNSLKSSALILTKLGKKSPLEKVLHDRPVTTHSQPLPKSVPNRFTWLFTDEKKCESDVKRTSLSPTVLKTALKPSAFSLDQQDGLSSKKNSSVVHQMSLSPAALRTALKPAASIVINKENSSTQSLTDVQQNSYSPVVPKTSLTSPVLFTTDGEKCALKSLPAGIQRTPLSATVTNIDSISNTSLANAASNMLDYVNENLKRIYGSTLPSSPQSYSQDALALLHISDTLHSSPKNKIDSVNETVKRVQNLESPYLSSMTSEKESDTSPRSLGKRSRVSRTRKERNFIRHQNGKFFQDSDNSSTDYDDFDPYRKVQESRRKVDISNKPSLPIIMSDSDEFLEKSLCMNKKKLVRVPERLGFFSEDGYESEELSNLLKDDSIKMHHLTAMSSKSMSSVLDDDDDKQSVVSTVDYMTDIHDLIKEVNTLNNKQNGDYNQLSNTNLSSLPQLSAKAYQEMIWNTFPDSMETALTSSEEKLKEAQESLKCLYFENNTPNQLQVLGGDETSNDSIDHSNFF